MMNDISRAFFGASAAAIYYSMIPVALTMAAFGLYFYFDCKRKK